MERHSAMGGRYDDLNNLESDNFSTLNIKDFKLVENLQKNKNQTSE